jgi:hypothetical protein
MQQAVSYTKGLSASLTLMTRDSQLSFALFHLVVEESSGLRSGKLTSRLKFASFTINLHL